MAIPRYLLCCRRLFHVVGFSSSSSFSLSLAEATATTTARTRGRDIVFLHHPLRDPIQLVPLLALARAPRQFSSESNTNSPAAFDYSDSEKEDDDDDDEIKGKKKKKKKKEGSSSSSILPPPYDPFSKKPVVEEPEDPKDLQEIFHKMRTEGLVPNAIKMFDALSKDGLTHEALQLFSQIKDKGNMPDVVAHTAVIEAYANAGQPKEALKVYMRMLASGVAPNAYTYAVLVRGLAAAPGTMLGDARRILLDMMDKGVRPNAATYTAVFEAFVRENRLDEGRQLLEQMKVKGFVPDERAVREHLSGKRGQDTFGQ